MEGKKGCVRTCSSFLFFIMAFITIWSSSNSSVEAALTPAQCKAERNVLVKACMPVVTRRPPSPFCCERLRLTHIYCVCSIITPKLAALIDLKYALKVIQTCGRQLPRHFKCGMGLAVYLYGLGQYSFPNELAFEVGQVQISYLYNDWIRGLEEKEKGGGRDGRRGDCGACRKGITTP